MPRVTKMMSYKKQGRIYINNCTSQLEKDKNWTSYHSPLLSSLVLAFVSNCMRWLNDLCFFYMYSLQGMLQSSLNYTYVISITFPKIYQIFGKECKFGYFHILDDVLVNPP